MRDALQHRSCPCEFRAEVQDGKRYIEGYFAVFDDVYEITDGASESIDPHAFDDQMERDVRCLIDHDTRLVVGRTKSGTLELKVDGHGLWFRVEINPDDSDAMNLYARVQRRDVSQSSFGFRILRKETHVDGATGHVHWTIKKLELYEGSIVTFPAYKSTEADARAASAKNVRRREVEAWKERQKARLGR